MTLGGKAQFFTRSYAHEKSTARAPAATISGINDVMADGGIAGGVEGDNNVLTGGSCAIEAVLYTDDLELGTGLIPTISARAYSSSDGTGSPFGFFLT
jgi:hypothetical protein